jgi:hypothetical protein
MDGLIDQTPIVGFQQSSSSTADTDEQPVITLVGAEVVGRWEEGANAFRPRFGVVGLILAYFFLNFRPSCLIHKCVFSEKTYEGNISFDTVKSLIRVSIFVAMYLKKCITL